jgi:hypothetical protein
VRSLKSELDYLKYESLLTEPAHQVAPLFAITYVAEVARIEPWKDTGKYALYFKEPALRIGPLPLVSNGKVSALQASRYTSFARLQKAKTLDDVF